MTLLDIYNKNKKTLETALKIQKLMEQQDNLNIDITSIKDASLYYAISSQLSAQAKAPAGEKFLCNILNLKRIPAKENAGDAIDSNGLRYEFKNSFTNDGCNLNIRQIRPWQNIDYYYCFYINEEELDKSLFFVLSKEDMLKEIELCASASHGTSSANLLNKNIEYSITIPVYNDNNRNTKRWKEKYLSLKLKNKILGE